MRSLCSKLALILLAALVAGCKPSDGPAAAVVLPRAESPPSSPPPRAYLLHIPGVSGESIVDHNLVAGFRQGKLDADIEIYDWTENDTGVPALQATERHVRQARMIADKLTAKFRADPRITIYLVSHSGGTALAVWALEDLPQDVKVERLLLLSSALSPRYDLSRALAHVRDKAYAFWSGRDTVVLSVGTRTFGTMDAQYCDAAGYVGFERPAKGDPKQYAKLLQIPYDPAWVNYDNFGDHIGTTETAFSKAVLVPLLEGKGTLRKAPATAPAAAAEERR